MKEAGKLDYHQAHLDLFQRLQKIGLINKAKAPRHNQQGKIFSDTELRYILKSLMAKAQPKFFDEVLDNLKLYTKTEAKILINTPMQHAARDKRRGVITWTLPYYTKDKLSYIVPQDFSYSYILDALKEPKYPKEHALYLLEYALRLEDWNGQDSFLRKLLQAGANPNIEVGTYYGMCSLLEVALHNDNLLVISLLITYGAEPNQYLVFRNAKCHLLDAMIVHPKFNDIETYPVLRTTIKLIAEKYGFNAIQEILTSETPVNNFSSLLVDKINREAGSLKPECVKLINLLAGLNQSKGCKLFKVVLTDNLEKIKGFLEAHSAQEQLALINDSFQADGNVGIKEFAKAFCNEEVRQYLVDRKRELSLQSAQAGPESKEEDGKDEMALALVSFASSSVVADMMSAIVQPSAHQEGRVSAYLSGTHNNVDNSNKAIIAGLLTAVHTVMLFTALSQSGYCSGRTI